MRFFKRIAGFLGFAKDDGGYEVKDQQQEDAEEQDDHQHPNHVRFRSNFQETGLPRKGFGVPVQVAVERPQVGPLIVPCISGDGGLQFYISVIVWSFKMKTVGAYSATSKSAPEIMECLNVLIAARSTNA
ncbi:hypothetical protein NC653_001591 [Populus alba x Populus x berolinensis]|uniref:Uncharacterized protein n=1 Tax=Populus alba x Populus x berolinensis TaxID=444605 RepID=A0AAD6WGR3_9ROSI|nr:hypothetical protein NC653_001591 [Populus alba x Populus x berolinensis]